MAANILAESAVQTSHQVNVPLVPTSTFEGMTRTGSSHSFRKRISDTSYDDDSTVCSSSQSISSCASSNKIHRSSSSTSARMAQSMNFSRAGLLNRTMNRSNQSFSLGAPGWITPESVCEQESFRSVSSKRNDEFAAPKILGGGASLSSNKVLHIASSRPKLTKQLNSKDGIKPIEVIQKALSLRGLDSSIKPCLEVDTGYFHKNTQENFDSYSQDAVDAVRSNDVARLRRIHNEGKSLQCCNRFGESLIHLACRRSEKEVVDFLINEGCVSLRVRDDYGRTPMHDACWRTEANIDLLDILIQREPELMMMSDKRGHTPLDYARREHWKVLIPFLLKRADTFQPVQPTSLQQQ